MNDLVIFVLGIGITSAIGCRSSSKPTADSRPVEASVDPAAVSTAMPVSSVSSPPRDAYADLPPLDTAFAERRVGFTRDDQYLGYEISACDPCPTELAFFGASDGGTGHRPALPLKYFWDPSLPDHVAEQRRKKNDEEVDRRLSILGIGKAVDGRVLRAALPARDLTFAVKTTRDDPNGRVTLWFGGRVGNGSPIYPMKIELGPHPMFDPPADERARISRLPNDQRVAALQQWRSQFVMQDPILVYANVSKDGKDVGIVAIATGSMWHEAGGVARASLHALLQRASAAASASGAPAGSTPPPSSPPDRQ